MECRHVQSELLEFDWSAAQRHRLTTLLTHLQTCETCQEAFEDFDRLRTLLGMPEAHPAPAEGWSAFEARLTGNPRFRRPRRSIAIAASIVLIVAAGILLPFRRPSTAPAPAQDGPIALTRERIGEYVEVFREVSGVFNHQTQWVLLASDGCAMGLRDTPEADEDRLLVVRLTAMHDNTLVSTADVAILPGGSAELQVPVSDGLVLRYHLATERRELGRVQLNVEFERPGSEAVLLAGLTGDLRTEPGQVLRAGEVATPLGLYGIHVELHPAQLSAGSS
ncbi:MAG: hypothetical protein GXY55_06340 [Phycisphaerae bacterium]|nr:hypothetical protein [Phycisphaerae bacterium]